MSRRCRALGAAPHLSPTPVPTPTSTLTPTSESSRPATAASRCRGRRAARPVSCDEVLSSLEEPPAQLGRLLHRHAGNGEQLRRRDLQALHEQLQLHGDRKSTRLNSSHVAISYAVFCLKKKKKTTR